MISERFSDLVVLAEVAVIAAAVGLAPQRSIVQWVKKKLLTLRKQDNSERQIAAWLVNSLDMNMMKWYNLARRLAMIML